MYYVVYGFLYLLSLLPLRILYLFSDFAFFILYHIVGYRKEVVNYNLSIAFPGKSERERKAIAKRFYKNFTDSFIETIKAISASPDFFQKRFTGNFSVFNELHERGIQKVQLHTGHTFNWEYGSLTMPLTTPYLFLGVYMPITSKLLDKIFYKLRSTTGVKLVSAPHIRTELLPYRHDKYVLALIADQNPSNPGNAFWVSFFNRPTPFLRAPENGARRSNAPVVFGSVKKERRGHYRIFFHLAEENPANTTAGELTKKYAAFLQSAIEEQPENWLWSHRRWKWEWKEEYGKLYN